MHITIDRETLLKPVQLITNVVERRQTLPILSNILFECSKDTFLLTATNLEVEIICTVKQENQEEGRITLPARKLFDICRALPEKAQLDIKISKEKAVIRSGKSRFTLSCLAADDFPKLEVDKTTETLVVAQKDLRKLIETTHFSMAQQDLHYYLNGMYFELAAGLLRSVATDAHRLAICEIKYSGQIKKEQGVIIPRKAIIEVLRLIEDGDEDIKILLSSNHIRFITNNITFTSTLIDGRFPDYQRVIKHETEFSIHIDREYMKKTLTRVSILANEKYKGIRMLFKTNTLILSANNPEKEEAEETITVEYSGEDIEIGFNASYLIDILNAIKEEKIVMHFQSANKGCMIQGEKDDECRYIVMPMRL